MPGNEFNPYNEPNGPAPVYPAGQGPPPQYMRPAAPPKKKFDEAKFYRFINILEIILRIVYGAVKGIKEAGPELMQEMRGETPEQLAADFGPGPSYGGGFNGP